VYSVWWYRRSVMPYKMGDVLIKWNSDTNAAFVLVTPSTNGKNTFGYLRLENAEYFSVCDDAVFTSQYKKVCNISEVLNSIKDLLK